MREDRISPDADHAAAWSEIALYQHKAQWCAAHGYHADAAEHTAHAVQLQRRLVALIAAQAAALPNPIPTGGTAP